MPFLPRDFVVPATVETTRFRLRSSFDYAVMSPDESRLLGCVYVDPPHVEGTDADIWLLARQSELPSGLETELESFLVGWLASDWPFRSVAVNGAVRKLARRGES